MRPSIFRVEEILRIILSFAGDSSGYDKRTLQAAAQVNSTWSSIALDYLWADISLQDWYRFIGVACKYVSKLRHSRCYRSHSYQHYVLDVCANPGLAQQYTERARHFDHVYAPRVRSIFIDFECQELDVCRHLLEPLSSFSLFNLRKLAALKIRMHPSPHRIELVKKFLRPALAECNLTLFPNRHRAVSLDDKRDALVALRVMRNLTCLSMRDAVEPEFCTDVIEVLRKMSSLEEVNLAPGVVSPSNMLALASNSAVQRIGGVQGAKIGREWFSMCVGFWNGRFRETLHAVPPSPVLSPLKSH